MAWKESKLYSVLTFTCPVCHEGDLFVSQPYALSTVGDVHPNCPVCGVKFEREPGFFYGAMYVSYALAVALFVTVWVALSVLAPDLSLVWQAGSVVGLLVVLSPFLYVLSKVIWANIFFHFDPKAAKGER
ncbi:MAG: DUF983 domain-containing protein [Flavobacteriales bacterium]|nr:DUF983 domain-containing protein [Flavobacteriales bacterium]MCB0769513.1 DUF983 domain-containing protein [Flavobacteriales bacterium]